VDVSRKDKIKMRGDSMTSKNFFYLTFGCILFGAVVCWVAMKEYVPQNIRSGHIYFCEELCGGQFYEFNKSKYTIECVCWTGKRITKVWRKNTADPITKGTHKNRYLYPILKK
jgi:hypothetical protein